MRSFLDILFSLSLSQIFFFIIFIIFLTPFSINFGGDGLSANYLFVLLPIFFILLKKKY